MMIEDQCRRDTELREERVCRSKKKELVDARLKLLEEEARFKREWEP